MKKQIATIGFTMLALAALAYAGSIKSWSSGETLRATDLNANFNHIHNTMVGGHGAKLVDADVAANAAIATSKVVGLSDAVDAGVVLSAQVAQVPKIILKFSGAGAGSVCSTTPCTLDFQLPASSITSVTHTGTGVYTVNLATTRANAVYTAIAVSNSAGTTRFCNAIGVTTTTVTINCYETASSAAIDSIVSMILYDNDAT